MKRREYVRFRFEKVVRDRFSREVNRKVQQFLDSLTEVERANIRYYPAPDSDHPETLLELRRRLNVAIAGFNKAKCKKDQPEIEDGYPSKFACIDEEGALERRPYYYRGLRLYADSTGIYIEGEIRQDSRRRLIRSRGDFYAGDYYVQILLGAPDEEKRQLAEAAGDFSFIDFDDYLSNDEQFPSDCKPSSDPVAE